MNSETKKNNILDSFKKDSKNLKEFILKYEIWWCHKDIKKFFLKNSGDKSSLCNDMYFAILEEKKLNDFLYVDNIRNPYRTKNTTGSFFYGTENQVTKKIDIFLNKVRYKTPVSFFCVYDFVNDFEPGLSEYFDGKRYNAKLDRGPCFY